MVSYILFSQLYAVINMRSLILLFDISHGYPTIIVWGQIRQNISFSELKVGYRTPTLQKSTPSEFFGHTVIQLTPNEFYGKQ